MFEVLQSMLADLFPVDKGIRLLGVTLSLLDIKDTGATGLERGVCQFRDGGKLVVRDDPHQVGKFLDLLCGKTRFSGGEPFIGQKHLSGGARIVADGGEQNGVTQRVFVFVATGQTDGGSGAFERLPFAPATGPRRLGSNDIIE